MVSAVLVASDSAELGLATLWPQSAVATNHLGVAIDIRLGGGCMSILFNSWVLTLPLVVSWGSRGFGRPTHPWLALHPSLWNLTAYAIAESTLPLSSIWPSEPFGITVWLHECSA